MGGGDEPGTASAAVDLDYERSEGVTKKEKFAKALGEWLGTVIGTAILAWGATVVTNVSWLKAFVLIWILEMVIQMGARTGVARGLLDHEKHQLEQREAMVQEILRRAQEAEALKDADLEEAVFGKKGGDA